MGTPKAGSKGGTKAATSKTASKTTQKVGITGQGALVAVASDFSKPTRSMLVAQSKAKGKSKAGAAVKPKGVVVPHPVSLPENTNGGAAPYDAPKEDYGGDQVSRPEGTYLGDVIASKANTDLPEAP